MFAMRQRTRADNAIVKNTLMSVLNLSVLLLTTNFVKHCQRSQWIYSAIASWIHSYFDNNRTDAWKTHVNSLGATETKFSYLRFCLIIMFESYLQALWSCFGPTAPEKLSSCTPLNFASRAQTWRPSRRGQNGLMTSLVEYISEVLGNPKWAWVRRNAEKPPPPPPPPPTLPPPPPAPSFFPLRRGLR